MSLANDISKYKSVVGGGRSRSTGGIIRINPYNPVLQPATGGSIDTGPGLFYDVAEWNLLEGFEESPIAHDGLLGATDACRIGYAYTFDFEVILDLRNQPELSLRWVDGAQILFRLGTPWATIPSANGDDGPFLTANGQLQARYYWCPLGRLLSIAPAVRPHDKEFVRQRVTGMAAGHVFLLPELGTITFTNGVIQSIDTKTMAGAYASYLGLEP